jgi:hypothetical protein
MYICRQLDKSSRFRGDRAHVAGGEGAVENFAVRAGMRALGQRHFRSRSLDETMGGQALVSVAIAERMAETEQSHQRRDDPELCLDVRRAARTVSAYQVRAPVHQPSNFMRARDRRRVL